MKSFNKYCNEIKDKYYNCDKVIKIDYVIVLFSITLLLLSIGLHNFYIFSTGIVFFCIFIYMLFLQKNFWLDEVPHYAYCHFNNANQKTTQNLLKIMHWNNQKEPKLINFNIFFPTISLLIAHKQKTYFDFQYCYNKTKLNDDLKECSKKAFYKTSPYNNL